MLVNILVLAFVSAYIAIAALGHVLLIAPMWPKLDRRQHAALADTDIDNDDVASAAPVLNLPG
jgi:hypothetical protein